MNILTEIVEKSDDIIALLDSNGFFDKNIFCPKTRLKIELQIRMQRKWEQENEIHLTKEEFEAVISEINKEELSETLFDLVDKKILSLSVSKAGELLYSLSDNSVSLLAKEESVKIFRNKK
jgi:hypothetical protein